MLHKEYNARHILYNKVSCAMYSRIVSVEVFNFMVYNHAVISFDEENIINIKGYNSGGKSTMLKAIAVCLTNMYPKAQTKFIRHGEKYFRIVVKFEDGVSIVRDKYITGQSLYEIYKDDKCEFTTKEGGKLTKVDAVPDIISNYLGLCVVSTGCLNYQVRQDPLWLIETTGSENYNSLNEILRTEEISRAGAMLNSDKNKLNSEITGIEASLQETRFSLKEMSGYSAELLQELEKMEALCKSLVAKYNKVASIYDTAYQLTTIEDIPDVSLIDDRRYNNILSVSKTIDDVDNTPFLPEISLVDDNRFVKLSGILETVKNLSEVRKPCPVIDVVDVSADKRIVGISSTLDELKSVMHDIKALDTEEKSVKAKLSAIVEKAKEKGIKFVQCDNCGTYIEVGV